MKKLKTTVLKTREKFTSQLKKFLKIKKQFYQISKELEQAFDILGTTVTPLQRAKFLCFVDWVKNRKELSVFELWGVKKNSYKVKRKFGDDYTVKAKEVKKREPTPEDKEAYRLKLEAHLTKMQSAMAQG